MQPIWKSWLGLPHVIGADPREGQGACCLVICKVLIEAAGNQAPSIEHWLELARQEHWIELQLAFDEHCAPVSTPRLHAMTLIRNGSNGLGLGIVVEGEMLLLPHHSKGVIVLPTQKLRLLQYRTLRQ